MKIASFIVFLSACVQLCMASAAANESDTTRNKSSKDSTQAEEQKSKKWYSPHYFPIQYAGHIGFLSAGVGYTARKDNYQLSLVYGYAPKSVAGVGIHTLTAKNVFHLHHFYVGEEHTLMPYASLGLSFEIGGRSFLTLPSNMPDGYYEFPKSVHLVAAGGIKMRRMTEYIKPFKGIEVFVEATTIDAYIWYKFLSDEVKMHQIITLAFGVNLLRR